MRIEIESPNRLQINVGEVQCLALTHHVCAPSSQECRALLPFMAKVVFGYTQKLVHVGDNDPPTLDWLPNAVFQHYVKPVIKYISTPPLAQRTSKVQCNLGRVVS
jgi:hypothetical protein